MSDSISEQDIGICIVCFSLLCLCFGTLIIPTYTKNYAKADTKRIWFAQLSLSLFRELDNIDGSMKLLHLKHFF